MIILAALLWTFSDSSTCFLRCRDHNGTSYLTYRPTNILYGSKMIFSVLFPVTAPNMVLVYLAVGGVLQNHQISMQQQLKHPLVFPCGNQRLSTLLLQ